MTTSPRPSLGECGVRILQAGGAAIAAGEIRAQARYDEAFHTLICEVSENPLLGATAEPHWRFLHRIMGEALWRAELRASIWRQHRDIFDAVMAGDARVAETLAVARVRVAADRLVGAPEGHGKGTTQGSSTPSRT